MKYLSRGLSLFIAGCLLTAVFYVGDALWAHFTRCTPPADYVCVPADVAEPLISSLICVVAGVLFALALLVVSQFAAATDQGDLD